MRYRDLISLNDFSAVTNGTAKYHTEDHPDDHDSSDANAHIPDDVQFTVEEVFNARLTVLCIWFLIRAGISYGSTTIQYLLVRADQCAVVIFIVG